MRVVAGLAGGRRLHTPPRGQLRPTSERVREAVFSALESLAAVEGARVLDLFAGTGALGIEALSRGAESATFVDDDPAAVAAIRANLAATCFETIATVVRSDVMRYLDGVACGGDAFDLALVDPPYAFDGWTGLAGRLPATLAAFESGSPVDPGPGWAVLRARRYGDSVVTLARRL